MMKTRKILFVLAAVGLAFGLSGCDSPDNKAASAPVYKVPTISQMDKEKQVLMAERKEKAAKDYIAKVKAEKEAQAKAEAEAAAQAQAQAQVQAQAQAQVRSGGSYQGQRSYGYQNRGNYQGQRSYRSGGSGGGGGGDLGWDPSKGTFIQDSARNDREHPSDGKVRCTMLGGKPLPDQPGCG